MKFTFDFSKSTTTYDRNKDESKTGYLKWTEINGSIEDLQRYVLNNIAICNCFYHPSITFTNSEKTKDNLKTANMIMLDLDAVKYNVEDFWNLMQETEITPNLVYTTKNNGHLKKPTDQYPNRYRCVYVLVDGIGNADLYSKLVYSIKSEIAMYCDDNSVFNDNTDKDCSHFFAGNDDAMSYVQCNVYPLNFFIERYGITVSLESDKNNAQTSYVINNCNERERRSDNRGCLGGNPIEKKFSDESFGNAWQCKNDIRLLYDFDVYNTYTTTQIDWNDGELFRYVGDIYVYNIERRWREKTDPITHRKYHTIVRYRYGEHRKRKIWTALLIRKLINPTITLEHLCYAALYELYNYMDNTDEEHYITRKHLKHIAEEILALDLTKYCERYRWKTKSGKNKTYITNRMERIKQGLSVTDVMAMANKEFGIYQSSRQKKEKQYEELSKRYDPNKSEVKNAEMLGVSKGTVHTLKKWIAAHEDASMDKPTTQDKITQPEAHETPQIESNPYPQYEEADTQKDMCCEERLIRVENKLDEVLRRLPIQEESGKNDLSWLKKCHHDLVMSKRCIIFANEDGE